jgi:hypothetical protein
VPRSQFLIEMLAAVQIFLTWAGTDFDGRNLVTKGDSPLQ